MGFQIGPVGSGGGGGGFSLGPAQNVFTGTTLAAAESARDTYTTANAAWLATYNGDTNLNIRLEFTDNGEPSAQYQTRNTAGDAWLVNQSFRAVRGDQGADGANAANFRFSSVTSRDAFFTANPDLLLTDLPVVVSLGNRVVREQIWIGATSPSAYDASTDSNMFVDASVMAATNSFLLGNFHQLTSGGENIFIRNTSSDVSYFPPWQFVGDHRDEFGRVVGARPQGRIYGNLTEEEPAGAVATTGSVEYTTTFNLTRNESLFGVAIVPAEDYTGDLSYVVTRMNTVEVSYDQLTPVMATTGTELEIWFPFPTENMLGTELLVDIYKGDGTRLLVRPLAGDNTVPYTEIRFREFSSTSLSYTTDDFDYDRRFVALQMDEIINEFNVDDFNDQFLYSPATLSTGTATITIQPDLNLRGFDIINLHDGPISIVGGTGVTINGMSSMSLGDQYDGGRIIADPNTDNAYILLYGSLASMPAPSDNFSDSVDLSLNGSDLTVTIGRTGSLADLAATITLPDGGSNVVPTASIHGLSLSIPRSVTIGDEVGVSQTVTYSISNHAQVQSLVLTVDGTAYNLAVPTRDGSHTESITLNSALNTSTVRTVTSTLTGTATTGTLNTLTYTTSIVALAPVIYWGQSTEDNAPTVDVLTFTSGRRTNPITVSTGDVTVAGNYFILLVPNDQDISSITDTVLGLEVTDIFVRAEDVRTISSIVYNSYVVGPLNVIGSENYVVRF